MDQDFIRNTLTIIQIVGGGVCFLLYRAYLAVAEKASQNSKLLSDHARELAEYKLHVAETYLTTKAMDSILAKLDRIEDKLDKKQDKAN